MKYYVMVISNGNLQLGEGKVTEWTDLQKAKNDFHGKCKTYGASEDVKTAYVAIMDNQFNIVGDYREFIDHRKEVPAS